MSEQEETTTVESVVESVQCHVCSSGVMRRASIKIYNLNLGIVLILGGLLCVGTGMLTFVGLIALLLGIYFMSAKKDVWLCDKCGAIVDRA